jgi:formylglycine-generating enzyme required for sulfatase activity
MAYRPTVFISSTSEDLTKYREQAAAAAEVSGFAVSRMEYWSDNGRPTLSACLEKVDEAEVVVVIVAHRYGWVPDDPANPDGKSITWLECERAWKADKPVLAFLVDPKYEWPPELHEDYRLVKEKNLPIAERIALMQEVERNEKKLAQFKRELSRKLRKEFTDAPGFRALVTAALLVEWQRRHPAHEALPEGDPEAYLKALEDDTRQIRITGLTTRRAEPYFFGVDEIYISLTTLASHEASHPGAVREVEQERRVALEQALAQRKVVIVGDPGSGKSTFLRRVAFELCRTLRGTRPAGAVPFLAPDDRRFPILIRVAEFAKLLAADPSPKLADSPDWIAYFLGKQSEEYRWGAGERFFRRKLEGDNCLVMVDGLDEAPELAMRERIARLLERATQAFGKCDFLVSTRPQTNVGVSVLKDFHPVRITDLEAPEIKTFFDHFARALALSGGESKKFRQDLETALESRPEIREMARNAVMLTALAVLQHNDQRLPEYRVDLYGSILGWLASAHRHKEGRLGSKECLSYMRRLALHMQNGPDGGRLVQIGKRMAAELLAGEFGGSVDANEDLLERETEDSGIVSSVGNDLKFWHLSFQEYLAALEIGGLSEKRQMETVVASGKLYQPEWRETMRLLGGVLFKQGEAKVEGLFQAILGHLGEPPELADQARCAALLGVMMRDLSRMGYQPKTPGYERTIRAAMRIFDAAAEPIEIRTRIDAADALGQVGDPRLEEDNWVEIPAGTFYMGAQKEEGRNYDPEAYGSESPVHAVTLRGFRIGRLPVTVQEFGKFLADGHGKLTEPEDWERQKQYPNRPVVGVSWFEAAAYCSWKGGRLPTEAEWERAARGPDGSRYPWGDKPPLDTSHANYDGAVGHPTPVGLFPKGNSSEGLCDILGNVWEWCGDWYGLYEMRSPENPRGPKDGKEKVLRGGSWVYDPRVVRVSFRDGGGPSGRGNGIGFRCAGELS